jgi:Group 4 capsule polysaccharide lipoprotein gfcB, YjbF
MRRNPEASGRSRAGRISRRAALVAGAAALTAACGEREAFKLARLTYDSIFGKAPENPASREAIEANPYAIVEVRVGSRAVANLILVQRQGDVLQWRSRDLKVIETRSGRLVKTAGLPTDILRTEFISADPVAAGLQKLTAPADVQRIVDFSGTGRYGRLVNSRVEIVGDDPITILGLNYPLRLARERNRVEVEDWEFENRYWYDPATGRVWRSTQYIDPSFPALTISILKPPAADV